MAAPEAVELDNKQREKGEQQEAGSLGPDVVETRLQGFTRATRVKGMK